MGSQARARVPGSFTMTVNLGAPRREGSSGPSHALQKKKKKKKKKRDR